MAANFYSLLSGKQRHANLNPESISGPSMKLLKRASGLYSRKKLEKSKSIKIRAVLPSLRASASVAILTDLPTPIVSKHSHGFVEIYAGATCAGKKVNNEDRVVMINTKLKVSNQACSYFAIFDGFSGVMACTYLRDNLHKHIFHNPDIHTNPSKAIHEGFLTAEQDLLKIGAETHNNSGSCALVALIIEKSMFVGNLGSSRCILSSLNGFEKTIVTKDHTIEDSDEKTRILQNGSEIAEVEGTLRVKPGNLRITRCLGCYKVKKNNPAIIAEPEIRTTRIKKNMDCLILVSDGISDTLSKYEITKCILNTIARSEGELNNRISKAVTELIKSALEKDTNDNLSALIIGFESLKRYEE